MSVGTGREGKGPRQTGQSRPAGRGCPWGPLTWGRASTAARTPAYRRSKGSAATSAGAHERGVLAAGLSNDGNEGARAGSTNFWAGPIWTRFQPDPADILEWFKWRL